MISGFGQLALSPKGKMPCEMKRALGLSTVHNHSGLGPNKEAFYCLDCLEAIMQSRSSQWPFGRHLDEYGPARSTSNRSATQHQP